MKHSQLFYTTNIQEKDGNYIIVNPIALAIDEAINLFKGEAERLGLKDEQDVVKMVK